MTSNRTLLETTMAPHEVNIKAAVKQLSADMLRRAGCETSETLKKRFEKRAWSILLDQGAEGSQELVADDVANRGHKNRVDATQACYELKQQLRPAEANQLQQLLDKWRRTAQYIPWTPQDPQDITPTPGPAPITDHEAVISLLLDLRGSCPQPAPSFTALPPLGSATVAAIQQKAEAAVAVAAGKGGQGGSSAAGAAVLLQDAIAGRDAAAAAQSGDNPADALLMLVADHGQDEMAKDDSTNWLPAALAATGMLQEVPLDAALLSTSTTKAATAPDTCRRDQGMSTRSSAATKPGVAVAEDVSVVDSLLAKMQQSSQPYQGLHKPLGLSSKSAAAGQAAVRSSSDVHKGRHTGMSDQQAAGMIPESVSRTAMDADAAVAAAAAMQPGVASLMLQSSRQPGSLPLALLGQQQDPQQAKDLDAILPARSSCCSKDRELDASEMGRQKQTGARVLLLQQQQQSEEFSRTTAEEQLVALSCLAVQGVWSAVGRLWDLALQGTADSSSRNSSSAVKCGLARPAAQQHLIVQVLHIAELRLRLQAFLQHFQSYTSTSSCGDDSSDATGSAVLHAFLAAVRELLDMHDAAMQALQHRQQQQQQLLRQRHYKQQQTDHPTAAAAVVPPAMSLLQLVVVLRDMLGQLQQLAGCCWCVVDLPRSYGCSLSPTDNSWGSSSTHRKFAASLQPCAYPLPAAAAAAAVGNSSEITVSKPFGGRLSALRHFDRQPRFSEAAAAEARAVAAEARAAALPWPAAAAAWVQLLDWDPSRWQVQRGFMEGSNLAETLYASLLHAGPQTAPLLRHLFAAAMQPLLHQIHNWAYLPDIHAAEAAAAAATMTSIAAKKSTSSCSTQASRNGRSSSSSQAPGNVSLLTLATAAAAAAAAAAAGSHFNQPTCAGFATTSTAAAVDDTAAEQAAAQVLISAWDAAQDRAPACPSFLADVEQQIAVAGLQLQLLQLLGPRGQQLAQRLGWLAELEQQELRDVLSNSSSSNSRGTAGGLSEQQDLLQQQRVLRLSAIDSECSNAATAVAAAGAGLLEEGNRGGGGGGSASNAGCFTSLALLMGGKGGMLSATAGADATGTAAAAGRGSGAAYLPFNLTTDQLKHAAAVVADYEAARHHELSRAVSDLADVKTAAAAAETARAIARHQEAVEAEETKQQLQQAAAARKAARKRQLLLQQQEEIAAAAARRGKARMDELALERSLLAQAAAAEHKAAMQHLQAEVHAAQRLGVQLEHHSWQQQQQHVRASEAADDALGCPAVEQHNIVNAASDVPAASNGILLHPSSCQHPANPQQQQQQEVASAHTRAQWGAAVYDPSPAAGRPSAAGAPPLAVIGSATAAAAAAAVPAAGKRSNSIPKLLLGMGSVLNPEKQRPSSGSSGSRRSSFSGGLSPRDTTAAAAAFGGSSKPRLPVNMGKWGMPVVPGTAAGMPSTRHRRTNSASGLLAAAGSSGVLGTQRQQQQQRRQVATYGGGVPARVSAIRADASANTNAEEVSADSVVLDFTGDTEIAEMKAATAAAAGGSSTAALSKWQQQQMKLMDSRRATTAGTDHNISIGGCSHFAAATDHQRQQQQQQQRETADSSAPLITTIEVLVIRPLLAQHRLTTVACWQLLLQEQQLLQKLSGMQALFFQQQADWVDLLLDGVERLLQPAAAGAVGLQHVKQGVAADDDDDVFEISGRRSHQSVLSPVAVQVVLEAAVQQSCLAGDTAAERLSIKVDYNKLLPGWGQCRTLRMHSRLPSSSSSSASVTDGLNLQYQLPWPVSLLVNEQQQQQYAQIFSVLLRLRRLQQQLTKQWATINARPGSAAAAGSRGRGIRCNNALNGGAARVQGYSEAGRDDKGKSEVDLDRLQQLRLWHSMAMHSVSSLLGTMLSELSGKLWDTFESEVTSQPVSLPEMIEAHARLLAAAQEVCLLPQFGGSTGIAGAAAAAMGGGSSNVNTPIGTPSLRKSIGRLSLNLDFGAASVSPRVAPAAAVNGTSVAEVVYQLADAAWFLQQQVQQVLKVHMKTDLDLHAAQVPAAAVAAASSSSFREGSSVRALGSILAQEDVWHGVSMAGWKLESLVRMLKGQLSSNRAAGVGEALAGLAARMGITS